VKSADSRFASEQQTDFSESLFTITDWAYVSLIASSPDYGNVDSLRNFAVLFSIHAADSPTVVAYNKDVMDDIKEKNHR
jgi:hypothetical protein